MSPVVKTTLIIASILVASGLLLMAIAACLPRGAFPFFSSDDFTQQTYEFDPARLTALSASTSWRDIELIADDTQAGKVVYSENEDHKVTVDLSETGTLTISTQKKKNFFNFLFFFSPPKEHSTVKIYISSQAIERLTLTSLSGDITGTDIHCGRAEITSTSGDIVLSKMTADTLKTASTSGDVSVLADIESTASVKTTSGDIVCTDSRCGDLTLSSTSGDVTVRNITVMQSFHAESTSGDVETDRLTAKDISLSATSGDISLSGAETDTVSASSHSGDVTLKSVRVSQKTYAKTTSGSLYVDELAGGEDIELHSVSGSVRGTLAGKAEDYRVSASSTSGKVSAPLSSSGKYRLEARTTSGSISISFTEKS